MLHFQPALLSKVPQKASDLFLNANRTEQSKIAEMARWAVTPPASRLSEEISLHLSLN
jgi:hypothetical protein